MRNLKVLSHVVKSFSDITQVRVVSPFYENCHELLVGHHNTVSRVDTRGPTTRVLFNVEAEAAIVDLAYFTVEQLLVCALDNGAILKYDMETEETVHIPDAFFPGIKAMKVSPDNELLVFVTSDMNVRLTDCRLETLYVSSLTDENFGQGEFINIGWGKKETQFHGSEGKGAAKKKVDVQELSSANDAYKNIVVTWRGDSALFAVGYSHNSVYTFKVYDREGILQYTCEKQPGLECNFSWRPLGNLIATTQQFPNKYVVAFFEKNGLKHGEFLLPFKASDVEIKTICWSSDSEVLCIWLIEIASKKSLLHLYSVNNYHWYLKYSIVKDDEIGSIFWDESNGSACGKLLHIFSTNGEYLSYNWVWKVDKSKCKTADDEALVGVVDGNKLLLTAFKKAVVPPPMAGWTVEGDFNINHVVFGPQHKDNYYGNYFLLVTDNSALNFYHLNHSYSVDFLWTQTLVNVVERGSEISQLLWLSDKVIVGICNALNKLSIMVIEISMENSLLESVEVIPVEEDLVGLCAYGNGNEILLQTSQGKLLMYSIIAKHITNIPFSCPDPCYEMDVHCEQDTKQVFGLTHRGRFYVNDREVANNINSFFVHSDFLLLTTLHHQLLCCPFSKDIADVLSVGTSDARNQSACPVSSRKLERGSKIITAVSCDSRVVLQLPRGNIEVIQPRALSLKMIGNFLDTLQYNQAFDLMRKQRINLNLIYDHNPEKFVENVETFINQVTHVSWLNLFISDLDDQDVTTTMYSTSYTTKQKGDCVGEKVKLICQILRQSLNKLNESNKYLLPIITTYVKTNDVRDLENALLLIKDLNVQSSKSTVSADEAIRYLLYMVNVDKMYDIALGLYDFDLVMYVASKSQKDPKEYVPFLNNLKAMDEKYKKFAIDDFLKRHESALMNLVMCGEEKEWELLNYIKKHNLYKTALGLVASNDSRYKSIADSLGSYLMAHRHYEEAGIVFMRCDNFEQALSAFLQVGDWKSAMFVVDSLHLEKQAIQEIQIKLLTHLKEHQQYNDALELLIYCGDALPSDMLYCCLDGHMYKKVISVCAKFKNTNLMETLVQPVAIEHYTSLLSLIIQNEEQFVKQKTRLQMIRQTKKEREELGEEGVEDCDLYSDTSSIMMSNTSRSSGRSFRSSKNRRKHERKLVSLKEGSRYEDVALIRSLHNLITSTFALRKDVNEINFLLQWLNRDQEVHNLQNSLEKVLTQMNSSMSSIWTPELWVDHSKSNFINENDMHDLPDPTLSLEPHLKIPPVIHQIDWKIQLLS